MRTKKWVRNSDGLTDQKKEKMLLIKIKTFK